jgi:hypothetical protein
VVSLDFTALPVASVHYGPIIYRLDALTGGAGKNVADGQSAGMARLIFGWRDLPVVSCLSSAASASSLASWEARV